MSLSREQIISKLDLPRKTVFVKEWGGDLVIQAMTVGDRLELLDRATKKPDENFMLFWIVKCCVDDEGVRLFSDDDVVEVAKKNPKVILALFDEIKNINNVEIDTDELAKN